MALWSTTVDRRDPPSFRIVQYNEPYGACLHGIPFAAMRLATDAKEICNVRTGRIRNTAVGAWIKRWWHLVLTPRTIPFVTTRTPTVSSLGVSRKLGMSDALVI